MNNASYLRSISLSGTRVAALTGTVRMAPITELIQHIRKRRIDAGHAPRLLDRHPFALAMLCNEPVHAPIKEAVREPVLSKELSDATLSPVLAVPGPFDEDACAERNGMFSDFDE